jgi:hypothetical protein
MMDIPNNAKHEEMMDFKKFAQSKNLLYTEEEVWIEGKFKEEGNNRIFYKDDFFAKAIHSSGNKINAKEIYQTYLEWFNRTLKPFEKERFFVSAKFVPKKAEEYCEICKDYPKEYWCGMDLSVEEENKKEKVR